MTWYLPPRTLLFQRQRPNLRSRLADLSVGTNVYLYYDNITPLERLQGEKLQRRHQGVYGCCRSSRRWEGWMLGLHLVFEGY